MAWVASAATPIATIDRSAVGSGRTIERNWSARARSTTRRIAWPRGVRRERPLTPVLGFLVPLDQATSDKTVDQPARRGRRAPDRFGQLPDGQGAAVREDVQAGQLREAKPQLPELTGKPDDQLAPERATHGHAFADLADVGQPVAGGEDRRRQVRLEPSGDGTDRGWATCGS